MQMLNLYLDLRVLSDNRLLLDTRPGRVGMVQVRVRRTQVLLVLSDMAQRLLDQMDTGLGSLGMKLVLLLVWQGTFLHLSELGKLGQSTPVEAHQVAVHTVMVHTPLLLKLWMNIARFILHISTGCEISRYFASVALTWFIEYLFGSHIFLQDTGLWTSDGGYTGSASFGGCKY